MKTNVVIWWRSIPRNERDKRVETILIKARPFKFVEQINEGDFLALRNAGKRSWFILSDLLAKYHRPEPYTPSQKKILYDFTREIETILTGPEIPDDIYKKDREILIDKYLKKLLK